MRVLVTGANGLIGSAVCARLHEKGHEIVAVLRPGSAQALIAATRVVEIDMAKAIKPEMWASHLEGVDAVVNCAGLFQQGVRDDVRGVHVSGAAALFQACEERGIRRLIHFSAIGVDRKQPSDFSATKLEGDRALVERDLDWIILRPSVVLGRPVYGASAMIRGLAALPFVPSMKHTGPLQVVRLEDVAETVSLLIGPEAPARIILELAGPERLSMDDVVARYRRWLGWKPARRLSLPAALFNLLYRAGDLVGWLGWRSPVRSTARKEIPRGAVGDPSAWIKITGRNPLALDDALARDPASIQERWFAALYFLKPVIFIVLVGFWIGTGLISLTVGYEEGIRLMLRVGTGPLAGPGVVAGALADIAVGMAIAYRPTARRGLYGAIALSLFYIVAGTILLPGLWREPLGPLMKIWPILVLHFVALAILRGR